MKRNNTMRARATDLRGVSTQVARFDLTGFRAAYDRACGWWEKNRAKAVKQAAEQHQAEQKQLKAARKGRAEQLQKLVASAESVIRASVGMNWRRPPSARNGMVVGVRLSLLPTGEVEDAYVVNSSGDEAFDRSVVNAVLKAERFPELQAIDAIVFDRYLRHVTIDFKLGDLRG